MKLYLLLIVITIVGSCSVPKSFYMDTWWFESQILLEENNFKLYHNDWHNGQEYLNSGIWSFSDSVLYLNYLYMQPLLDSINRSVIFKETDSVVYTELYWFTNKKLYPLNLCSCDSLNSDSNSFHKNLNGLCYNYNPYYFYKKGKIKDVKLKLKSTKLEHGN